MPETPRFYISQRRFSEARESFNFIAKMNGKSKSIADYWDFIQGDKDVNPNKNDLGDEDQDLRIPKKEKGALA
jgi:hypothetical protein